jgi:hypothetical protein
MDLSPSWEGMAKPKSYPEYGIDIFFEYVFIRF